MGLLQLLKKDSGTRKIFGKRELKIIEKQMMGVNLTQSEKNRLSRDIRRKLDFISKAARFEDEFRLKKGAGIQAIIDDAVELMLQDKLGKDVKQIFIFGSTSDNTRMLRSDIDISVSIPKISLKDATRFRMRISGRVDDLVDVQVFETLPEKIRKEIKTKGKILFSR